jgi:hypothetical protein
VDKAQILETMAGRRIERMGDRGYRGSPAGILVEAVQEPTEGTAQILAETAVEQRARSSDRG